MIMNCDLTDELTRPEWSAKHAVEGSGGAGVRALQSAQLS